MASAENRPSTEANEKRNTLKLLLQFAPALGVLIAILALLTNIQLRKKELTCRYLGSDSLVNVNSSSLNRDVKVDFEGKTITSLNKMRFVVKNTGAGAIRGEDVKEIVGFQFPTEVNILSASVDDTNPSHFSFKVIVPERDKSQFLRCDFPLLNSGDEAYISIYVYNSVPRIPKLVGRIVDVREIVNVDSSQNQTPTPLPFIKSTAMRKVAIWVLLVFNGLLVAVSAFLLCAGAISFVKLKRWNARWGEKYKTAQAEWRKDKLTTLKWTQELAKRGIPAEPSTLADTWGELFSFSLVFFALTVLTAFSCIFIFTSPWAY